MSPRTLMILAGGTGGHVYPALAVARYLRSQGIVLTWMGTPFGLEARIVPANGIDLLTVSIRGLRGRGLMSWVTAPVRIVSAVIAAVRHIWKTKPAAVLGMGGFVSGPGGLAAWLLGIPLYIHEQNAVPGLTNRILARIARRIMQGFPGSFPQSARVTTTGNPVRADILAVVSPQVRFAGKRTDILHILVIGGSQGARILNTTMPSAMQILATDRRIEVRHQTGAGQLEDTRQRYAGSDPSSVVLSEFIDDMAQAYAWADIVLCRAGALTIAELCVVGVASILVPYPHAVDDHQTANARFLVQAGGAALIPEAQMTPENLAATVSRICSEPAELMRMAVVSRSLGRRDATETVGTLCMEAFRA